MEHQNWEQTVLRKESSKTPTPKTQKSSVSPDILDDNIKSIKMFTVQMGRKIASLRNQKGWSQDELAKKLNVTKNIITDIEKGDKYKYDGNLVNKLKKEYVLGNFSWD